MLTLDALAQLGEHQVVLLPDELRDQPQCRRVEGTALTTGARQGGEAAGLTAAAQESLNEGAADAEAGGEVALRAGALVVSLGDPIMQMDLCPL